MKRKRLNLAEPQWDFKTQHEMKLLVRVKILFALLLWKQLIFIDGE